MKTRDKNKNQYGTFAIARSKFRKFKTTASLIILGVVFVFGGALLIKDSLSNSKKPKVQALTQSQDTSALPDWWLKQYFGSSVCSSAQCQPTADPDNDGLSNAQEYFYHTDPLNAHTVKDTLNDGQLVAAGYDPSQTGRVTFDQAATPDNIFGDSLLFSSDVQNMVSQLNDISKVNIPLPAVSDLKVSLDDTPQSDAQYQQDVGGAIEKYFPPADMTALQNSLQTGDPTSIQDVSSKAGLLVEQLKVITVPVKYSQYHQYLIAMFQLLPEVINIPDGQGPEMDAWYDEAQQFYADEQKLQLQEQILNKTN